MKKRYFHSPLGIIEITSLNNKIIKITLVECIHESDDDNILKECEKELIEYFEGKRKYFNIPIDLIGTEFQKSVWNELKNIPYASLTTYKEVSIKLGYKNHFRAVGSAIGKNPLLIIIPCHRVIGQNGKLTGFSAIGTVETKQKLINLEKSNNYLN